jgi:transposase InsO family protein
VPSAHERERPGELLHIDAKKLGRIVGGVGHRISGNRTRRGATRRIGFECLHVAMDDTSRVAYAELLPDESAASAVVFLEYAVAWLATLGIRVEAVMTDNSFCYVHRQYATALATLDLRHLRTRPYTPRTNGKAERFIQTVLREWPTPNPIARHARVLSRTGRGWRASFARPHEISSQTWRPSKRRC